MICTIFLQTSEWRSPLPLDQVLKGVWECFVVIRDFIRNFWLQLAFLLFPYFFSDTVTYNYLFHPGRISPKKTISPEIRALTGDTETPKQSAWFVARTWNLISHSQRNTLVMYLLDFLELAFGASQIIKAFSFLLIWNRKVLKPWEHFLRYGCSKLSCYSQAVWNGSLRKHNIRVAGQTWGFSLPLILKIYITGQDLRKNKTHLLKQTGVFLAGFKIN